VANRGSISAKPDPIFGATKRWKQALAVEHKASQTDGNIDDRAATARIEAMKTAFATVPTTFKGMPAKINLAELGSRHPMPSICCRPMSRWEISWRRCTSRLAL